ncbi:MAG TPA: Ig-like domain-containing protein [Gemmatimonadaceae bacterium]|nr:Ig-like domain-containing protein [Gemmatimonadaceae bacterium]
MKQIRLRRTILGAAVVALSALAVAACSEGSTEPGGDIVRIDMSQTPLSQPRTNMLRGTTLQLLAAPVNADEDFVNLPITWTSSDNSKATVDASGKVTTVSGGDVTISAAAGGKTGTYDINIQYPVGTVTVTPANPTIRQEGAVALTATLLGTDNTAAIGRSVTWTSSNTAVATVNSSTGSVSGVTEGTATITATSEGVTGQTVVTVSGSPLVSTVTVSPPSTQTAPIVAVGGTMQLSRTSRAASGTVVTGTTATWSSSSNATATVSTSGLVTCVSAGSATITAVVPTGEGTNTVSGSLGVTCAVQLVSGVPTTLASLSSGSISQYAIVVPAGTTNISISTTGGGSAGDADIYLFSPTRIPPTLNTSPSAFAYSSRDAVSALSGNAESISLADPAAGTWRLIVYAWSGAGTVSNLVITATTTP